MTTPLTEESPLHGNTAAVHVQELPEHLLSLPGAISHPWAIWRQVGLRGAGFPIEILHQLASPSCAEACDTLLAQQALLEQRRKVTIVELEMLWDKAPYEEQLRLRRIIRSLRKGHGISSVENCLSVEALAESERSEAAATTAFKLAYKEVQKTLSDKIADLAASEHFRQAIIWQNRDMLHKALLPMLQSEAGPRNAKRRERDLALANYIQRYCAKNDTIGFFGPVGWASFEPSVAHLVVEPGTQLLSRRNVYFESWCIQAVGQAIAQRKEMRPWLVPMRVPDICVLNNAVYSPSQGYSTISQQFMTVLLACDGQKTAHDLAQALVCTTPTGFFTEVTMIYDILEQLQKQELITLSLPLPVSLHTDQALRKHLERITDTHVRDSMLALLDRLEQAKDQVVQAREDAQALDGALENLDTLFRQLTGNQAKHGEGKVYVGRTLLVEDCQRDVSVLLGSSMLETLGPPLSLLLQSARWFALQVTSTYREALTMMYQEMARKIGRTTIDASSFWQAALGLILGKNRRLFQTLLDRLYQRWNDILQLPLDVKQVHYTTQELQEKVQAAFSAPYSGWRGLCYYCPDVMLAATSKATFTQGDYHFVLGELHAAGNTLDLPLFLQQHPEPSQLYQAFASDLPEGRVILVPAIHWPRQTARTAHGFISPRDWLLLASPDTGQALSEQTLPIGSFVVTTGSDGLKMQSLDKQLSFDIVDVFSSLLGVITAEVFSLRRLVKGLGHAPRVTIDRLVVCRESWRCTLAEMSFAFQANEDQRFYEARRWMHSHGMPRFLFVKAPGEVKPFYLDFASPLYVELLAKTVRVAKKLGQQQPFLFTEMLPAPDDYIWLEDMQGQRYTSELRMVVFDVTSKAGVLSPDNSQEQA